MEEGLKKEDFEPTLYPCQICGELKVRRRWGVSRVPKYCEQCRKKLKKSIIKKVNLAKKLANLDDNLSIEVTSPDGAKIKLRSEKEKEFYLSRKKAYMSDYAFTNSVDLGILSQILNIEIIMHRVNKELNLRQSSHRFNNLSRLSEEYRELIKSLGISKTQRDEKMGKEDIGVVLNDLIQRTKQLISENPHLLKVMCPNCGAYIENQINILKGE